MVARGTYSMTLLNSAEYLLGLKICLIIGPKIISIFYGKIILNIKYYLLSLFGISFLPPPGWFIAPINERFLMFLKFPLSDLSNE
jgi:hypothetical protein